MTDKLKVITSKDTEGNEVQVMLKSPAALEHSIAQLEYNRAFTAALESGALLRQKLSDYMTKQGIWNEDKQKENDEFVSKIQALEEILMKGGIKLSEAKEFAMKLKTLRAEFQDFLAERNSLDQNSAEGQADNARFSELVRCCMLNPKTKKPFFPAQKDYQDNSGEPWVIEAAGQLASVIYGLPEDYDSTLEENKFLKEFDFVDDDLRLLNDDGHLVDSDGRLINDKGRFVAYRTKGKTKECYFVNRQGEEVVEVDRDGEKSWIKKSLTNRKPFLTEDGSEISAEDEPKEEVVSAKKPVKKARAKKVVDKVEEVDVKEV
jgi:hypothetical protein